MPYFVSLAAPLTSMSTFFWFRAAASGANRRMTLGAILLLLLALLWWLFLASSGGNADVVCAHCFFHPDSFSIQSSFQFLYLFFLSKNENAVFAPRIADRR